MIGACERKNRAMKQKTKSARTLRARFAVSQVARVTTLRFVVLSLKPTNYIRLPIIKQKKKRGSQAKLLETPKWK